MARGADDIVALNDNERKMLAKVEEAIDRLLAKSELDALTETDIRLDDVCREAELTRRDLTTNTVIALIARYRKAGWGIRNRHRGVMSFYLIG